MTSVNVFSLGSVKPGQTVMNASAGRTKADRTQEASVFASMMNSNNYSAGSQYSSADVKGSTSTASVDSFERQPYREREIKTADTVAVSDKINESQEELDNFEENVIKAVAEELGVSEDSIKEALEVLGLTVFDLMNPQNLVQLVIGLTEENSTAALLTNPQFLELMQDVGEISTQLMEDLGLAPEQMDELVEQMDLLENPQPVTEDTFKMPEAADAVVVAEQEEVTEPVLQGAQPAEELPETRIQRQEAAQQEEMTDSDEQQHMEEGQKPQESSPQVQKHDFTAPQNQTAPVMQAVSEMNIPEAAPLPEDTYLSIDTMDLIEQIAENVRVNISHAETSLEMQLNPEHLGKLYLQISAKEGAVNAQIAASNEAVKVALEAQVAELRESLNQAGVKVDAIEVTVASHEFEQNLEQNFHKEEKEGERQEEQSMRRRNLNLSSLDELSSVMSEEEALAAQIMRDNGNSVDLTA